VKSAPLIFKVEQLLIYLAQQHQESASAMPIKLLDLSAFENNIRPTLFKTARLCYTNNWPKSNNKHEETASKHELVEVTKESSVERVTGFRCCQGNRNLVFSGWLESNVASEKRKLKFPYDTNTVFTIKLCVVWLMRHSVQLGVDELASGDWREGEVLFPL
jgi:hypothetical protein